MLDKKSTSDFQGGFNTIPTKCPILYMY